jgi:hypothetical protein
MYNKVKSYMNFIERFPCCIVVSVFLALTSLSGYGAVSNSVARVWDERALAAIRVDTPHPPAQART